MGRHPEGPHLCHAHLAQARPHGRPKRESAGSAPGPAANNFIAAVGQTKGSLVQVNLTANTDLTSVAEFQRLVVRESEGSLVRLENIAEVVLGSEDNDSEVRFSGQTAVFMGIFPLSNASALEVIKGVRKEMAAIQAELPSGLCARIAYDATEYIDNAIQEVTHTLVLTLFIVALIIFLFLGSLRSTFIPMVAIPLPLIGGLFLMQVFGFSINLLTLL
ncbi:MAG: efflux RND transporter permease subunit, partial [Desulfobacteraceae bacterium]|nr:efflux RND transporter permease subunit [Desulfobacteraceae bacterium]